MASPAGEPGVTCSLSLNLYCLLAARLFLTFPFFFLWEINFIHGQFQVHCQAGHLEMRELRGHR